MSFLLYFFKFFFELGNFSLEFFLVFLTAAVEKDDQSQYGDYQDEDVDDETNGEEPEVDGTGENAAGGTIGQLDVGAVAAVAPFLVPESGKVTLDLGEDVADLDRDLGDLII